jgi:hypothetical protein
MKTGTDVTVVVAVAAEDGAGAIAPKASSVQIMTVALKTTRITLATPMQNRELIILRVMNRPPPLTTRHRCPIVMYSRMVMQKQTQTVTRVAGTVARAGLAVGDAGTAMAVATVNVATNLNALNDRRVRQVTVNSARNQNSNRCHHRQR